MYSTERFCRRPTARESGDCAPRRRPGIRENRRDRKSSKRKKHDKQIGYKCITGAQPILNKTGDYNDSINQVTYKL
jgi:hypothetical protein